MGERGQQVDHRLAVAARRQLSGRDRVVDQRPEPLAPALVASRLGQAQLGVGQCHVPEADPDLAQDGGLVVVDQDRPQPDPEAVDAVVRRLGLLHPRHRPLVHHLERVLDQLALAAEVVGQQPGRGAHLLRHRAQAQPREPGVGQHPPDRLGDLAAADVVVHGHRHGDRLHNSRYATYGRTVAMLSLDLGDGLALAPLEPWQAARVRGVRGCRARLSWSPGCRWRQRHQGRADSSARFLQRYADDTAAGRPAHLARCARTARWSAGRCSRSFDPRTACARSASGWPRARRATATVTRAVTAMLDWALRRARPAPRRVALRAGEHREPQRGRAARDDPRRDAARVVRARRPACRTSRSGPCSRRSGGLSDYWSL